MSIKQKIKNCMKIYSICVYISVVIFVVAFMEDIYLKYVISTEDPLPKIFFSLFSIFFLGFVIFLLGMYSPTFRMLLFRTFGAERNEETVKSKEKMMKMERPNLSQMWETFTKIPAEDNRIRLTAMYNMIRSQIDPMISRLKDDDMINWYCFLIHDRHSGVPTSEDDNNPYFHVRFALKKNVDPKEFLDSLPNFCVMTRKIRRNRVESILGIDKSIIKNEKIEEAWRIIGEQSEWLLNMLNIHKEDVDIPPQQVAQFLHFYANMTQLQVR